MLFGPSTLRHWSLTTALTMNVLLLFLLLPLAMSAGPSSFAGTEFLVLTKGYSTSSTIVVTRKTTNVTEVRVKQLEHDGTIDEQNQKTCTLTKEEPVRNFQVPSESGGKPVVVKSTHDVTVQVYIKNEGWLTGYLALPKPLLSSNYVTVANDCDAGVECGISIISLENDVNVRVTLGDVKKKVTFAEKTYGRNETIQTTLMEYHVMTIAGKGSHLMGSRINSSAPVAVFVWSRPKVDDEVDDDDNNNDAGLPLRKVTVNQLTPEMPWGKVFIVGSYYDSTVFVMSKEIDKAPDVEVEGALGDLTSPSDFLKKCKFGERNIGVINSLNSADIMVVSYFESSTSPIGLFSTFVMPSTSWRCTYNDIVTDDAWDRSKTTIIITKNSCDPKMVQCPPGGNTDSSLGTTGEPFESSPYTGVRFRKTEPSRLQCSSVRSDCQFTGYVIIQDNNGTLAYPLGLDEMLREKTTIADTTVCTQTTEGQTTASSEEYTTPFPRNLASGYTGGLQLCSCACPRNARNVSVGKEEEKEIIANIVRHLKVNRSSLSSTLRKKTSAQNKDMSPAASAAGLAVGVAACAFVFGLIVIPDVVQAVYHLYMHKHLFQGGCCRCRKRKRKNRKIELETVTTLNKVSCEA